MSELLRVNPNNSTEILAGDMEFHPHGINRFTIYYSDHNKDKVSPNAYLQRMSDSGINSLRMVVPGYSRDGIEPKLGEYDESLLKPLDMVFELADKLGIYIILCLFDYNGFWTPWNPDIWKDQVYSDKFSNPKDFFGSQELRKYEDDRVECLVNHFKRYPNLFAWEPMNEMNYLGKPHGSLCEKVTMNWFDHMAEHINKLDSTHMISGSLWGGEVWESLCKHQLNHVIQIHTYDETEDPKKIATNIQMYVEKTKEYNKPTIISEFASTEKNPKRYEFVKSAIQAAQSRGSSAWLYASTWDEFGEMDDELFNIYKETSPNS